MHCAITFTVCIALCSVAGRSAYSVYILSENLKVFRAMATPRDVTAWPNKLRIKGKAIAELLRVPLIRH